MPNNFPNLKRIAQENSYYCGPASLEMLLGNFDVIITQQQVVDSLGLQKDIFDRGITIEQMGSFVKEYYPQFTFWFKFNSTVSELSKIINEYHYPVGVEWQGIFDYPDEEINEDEDDDPGHVSIITDIDTNHNVIRIADPDSHYAGNDRQFSILQFERRWWDLNEIRNPITHKIQEVDDYHGLFLITEKRFIFPDSFQLLTP